MTPLDELCRIAEVEFAYIVVGAQAMEPKRRLFIRDGSFVDVWVSSKLPGRFGFHWERTHLDGTFFRYDNFPDPAWCKVETFPHHFHDGSLARVVASPFPSDMHDPHWRPVTLRLAAGRGAQVCAANGHSSRHRIWPDFAAVRCVGH